MHTIWVIQRDRKSPEESEIKLQQEEIKENEGNGVQEWGIEREEGNVFFK